MNYRYLAVYQSGVVDYIKFEKLEISSYTFYQYVQSRVFYLNTFPTEELSI